MARITRTEDERLIIAFHIRQMSTKYNTGAECAEKFGVTAPQWSAWLNGRRTPEDDRLVEIAKFLDTTVEAMKEPPPNWEEEKAKILQAWAKKKGGDANTKAETAELEAGPTPRADNDDDGTDDYIAIVAALAKVQAKYNKGLIPPDRYESKMKSIREFIDFSYRDVKA
jgi:transcriptional regulator with XRE-family HTH domain